MNRDEFDQLIKRLEGFAQRNPRGYVARVAFYAALGYLYLFGALGILLLGIAFLVWMIIALPSFATIKIALLFGIGMLSLFAIIVRAMWIKLSPPEGLELTRSDVPALFGLLDELSDKLGAPQFHHVLLDGEFNASVVQIPRLGVLGWQRNYLMLGLPLMHALSPAELRAVLAHEFAHLSGNHSRFACWIYRVRLTWMRILAQLNTQPSGGSFLLNPFLNWYAPFFNGYSFVLARANEYEADRCAAEIAGIETMAQALTNIELRARQVQEFWPKVHKLALTQSSPPTTAFANLAESLSGNVEHTNTEKWLSQALARQTSNADTHPCLTDRLKGIGLSSPGLNALVTGKRSPESTINAAQQFLGGKVADLQERLQKKWNVVIEANWNERFKKAAEMQKRVSEIEQGAQKRALNPDEQWEKIQLLAELKSEAEMRAEVLEFLASHPEHAAANFFMAQHLIEEDDETAFPYFEKSTQNDVDLIIPAGQLLHAYYTRTGQPALVREMENRMDQHLKDVALAREERSRIIDDDTFEPHELEPGVVDKLRHEIEKAPEVTAAYVVRKKVEHFPEKPLFLMVVDRKTSWIKTQETAATDQIILNQLASNLRVPGQMHIFFAEGALTRPGKIIQKLPGAEIYRRSKT